VIADAKEIALGDRFASNALAVVFDTIRRTHIDHVVLAIEELDHGVLARHVRIFDRHVARLLTAANDEAVLVHGETLAVVDNR
jgi:hypothetical protein